MSEVYYSILIEARRK